MHIHLPIHSNKSRAHSLTFPSLHLRHSSFSNSSVALPKSQLILQTFRCYSYVTAHSPTLLSLLLRHRLFTYVTWRAAHDCVIVVYCQLLEPLIHCSLNLIVIVETFSCHRETISCSSERDGGFRAQVDQVHF